MEQPLSGRTVVITRAPAQAGEFVSELERFGASVMVCPTIEITDPESYARLDEAIDHLYGYDWLIFTSANAVAFFLRRLAACGREAGDLDELKVCAIGDATAERERLSGLNLLIPRATVARDYLPKALEEAGARVDVVPAYRSVVPENLDRGRLSAMLAAGADCIAFTSSSTVKNLALLFDTNDLGPILKGLTVACIGDITASTAAEYGLRVDIQPPQFTIPDLARAIAEHY